MCKRMGQPPDRRFIINPRCEPCGKYSKCARSRRGSVIACCKCQTKNPQPWDCCFKVKNCDHMLPMPIENPPRPTRFPYRCAQLPLTPKTSPTIPAVVSTFRKPREVDTTSPLRSGVMKKQSKCEHVALPATLSTGRTDIEKPTSRRPRAKIVQAKTKEPWYPPTSRLEYQNYRGIMVQCPYDPHHWLKESGLVIHLLKCKPPPGYKICKYNIHHIYKEEEEHNCEDTIEMEGLISSIHRMMRQPSDSPLNGLP